jgi:hypothetical protein
MQHANFCSILKSQPNLTKEVAYHLAREMAELRLNLERYEAQEEIRSLRRQIAELRRAKIRWSPRR